MAAAGAGVCICPGLGLFFRHQQGPRLGVEELALRGVQTQTH